MVKQVFKNIDDVLRMDAGCCSELDFRSWRWERHNSEADSGAAMKKSKAIPLDECCIVEYGTRVVQKRDGGCGDE